MIKMEEFTMEAFLVDEFVIDIDYEFDAAQYFDFCRPETLEDTIEAERWLESAASYPPSPFIPKSNWRYDIPENIGSDYCDSRSMSSVVTNSDASSRGLDFCNHMDQDIPKSKTKDCGQVISIKEFNFNETHSKFQKLYGKMDKCSQNSYLIENLATKRQKLDAGYLCKVSHLKHQALFLHKVPNKAGHLGVSLVHPRSKVTIPREPNLETANRAQRHRSKVNAESAEHAKSNTSAFKARPLNRKIFESPALPLTKKNTLPLTECQEFQLRTSERARQHAHNNVATRCNHNSVSQNETKDSIRPNSVNSLEEEKCEVTQKVKSHPCHKKLSKGELGVLQNIKQETRVPLELDFPEDKTFLNQPPIELFNKLSLASVHTNIKPHSKMPPPSKGSKENTESSFHLEHEMMKAVKKNSPSFGHNQYQCGSESTDRRNTEAGARYNINRNLDIR
ncbi:hypothetical protein Pint_17299 [Pistacia integerrima]|uniref:Uncharacterized protein n=1 Tax=Pistacia integerrima TaxID=434235 RepID=A0ACC0YZV0_9ROSI|nr:hypothetical protein Pint_17299 [Pistacia integerrima]